MTTSSEGSDAINDVAAIGDFDDVSTESVGAVASNDNGWFRFVFGSSGASSRATSDFSVGGGVASGVGVGVVGVVITVAFETGGGGAMFFFGIVVVGVGVEWMLLEMEITGVERRGKGVGIHMGIEFQRFGALILEEEKHRNLKEFGGRNFVGLDLLKIWKRRRKERERVIYLWVRVR